MSRAMEMDDPFDWDVDRVARELCTPKRSWSLKGKIRLPDPAGLEPLLRLEGIDGETLLTCEHAKSGSLAELAKELHMNFAERSFLYNLVNHLQKRSLRYDSYTRDEDSSESEQFATPPPFSHNPPKSSPKPASKAQSSPVSDQPLLPTKPNTGTVTDVDSDVDTDMDIDMDTDMDTDMNTDTDGDTDAEVNANTTPRRSSTKRPVTTLDDDEVPSLDANNEIAPNGDARTRIPPSPMAASSGPPRKKKRVAPINLQSATIHERAPRDMDDEPQTITATIKSAEQTGNDGPWLSYTDVIPDGPTFSFVSTKKYGLAQKAAYRHVKRALMHGGQAGWASGDVDDDEELPVFGESGDDEMDDETWEEIEEERKEREKMKSRILTREQVDAAIDEALDGYRQHWRENKLLRLQRTAYRLWSGAHRTHVGSRREDQIASALKLKEDLEARLAKLIAEIHKTQWTSAQSVKLQAGAMEYTATDIEEQLWKLQVLTSLHAPAKPQTAKLSVPRKEKTQVNTGGSEDEIFSSSSDGDDMTNFIINDYNEDVQVFPEQVPQTPRKKHPAMPGASAANFIDLTLDSDTISTPQAPRAFVSGLIDLTTPASSQSIPHTETPDSGKASIRFDLEDMPSNLDFPIERWAALPENHRLLLRMMATWNPTVREHIFKVFQQYSPVDVWERHVHKGLLRVKGVNVVDQALLKQQTQIGIIRFFDAFLLGVGVKRQKFKVYDKICSSVRNRVSSNYTKFDQFYVVFKEYMALVDTEDLDGDGPSATRHKPLLLDRAAQQMRSADQQRLKKQEDRKRENRAVLSNLPAAQRRLVINETKAEAEGLVYVNDNIAKLIKDHQVAGVRWLWNHVVADRDESDPQGCLLADTMGLGKTMQVITLLVAIQEAAKDRQVKIPEALRESRTLILCPPTLVDNWERELDHWDEGNILGNHLKAHSNDCANPQYRIALIERWQEEGGVLVMGYNLFKSYFFRNRRSGAEIAIETSLVEFPTIVIADEAHALKNNKTQAAKAAARFATSTRIALTGSPLSNNVLEYYGMIEWVANNFLGPRSEFKQLYATPIQVGLYATSSPADKRRALKKLKILTDTVSPRVLRRTTNAIKDSLPPKREFVIMMPLTKSQRDIYNFYVSAMKAGILTTYGNKVSTTELLSLLSILGLVCNHPKIYHTKLSKSAARTNLLQGQRDVSSGVEGSGSGSGGGNGSGSGSRSENGNTDGDGSKELPKGDMPSGDENTSLPLAMIQDALARISTGKLDDVAQSWKVKVLLIILHCSMQIGDKVLIFTQSVATLDYLEALLKKERILSRRLDGSTPMKSRNANVQEFNDSKSVIAFLISTKAGGQGLNIHGANRVVIFDFLWNPSEESQALGRAYRIGQTKPVYVYRFVSSGTFEERKLETVLFKLQLFSRVVDGAKPIAYAKHISLDILTPAREVETRNTDNFRGRDRILDRVLDATSGAKGISEIVGMESVFEEDVNEALNETEKQEVAMELAAWKCRRGKGLGTVGLPNVDTFFADGSTPYQTFVPPPQVPQHHFAGQTTGRDGAGVTMIQAQAHGQVQVGTNPTVSI